MPLLDDHLTRPENAAELAERRKILRRLTERGGCWACLHRDPTVLAWGRSVCSGNPSRAFPLCMKDGRSPAFELDEKQLTEAR